MGRKPKQKTTGLEELTPLELTIMQVLWDRGNATAAEVAEELSKTRPLADTTIHTVLSNLRKKGYIDPIPTVERAFRFAPSVPRQQVAERTLRQLLGDFFGGSAHQLVAHLMNDSKTDDTEITRIRALLRNEERKGKK